MSNSYFYKQVLVICILQFLFVSSGCSDSNFIFPGNNREIEKQIEELYKKEIDEAKLMPTSLSVEITFGISDLNGDGLIDILAFLQHPYFCGTAGCKFVVLIREKNGGLRQVLNTIAHDNVDISKNKHNGYFDILTSNDCYFYYVESRYKLKCGQ